MKKTLLALAFALTLVPSLAHAQDPDVAARAGEPSTVKTNRASERPYRQPDSIQTGVPGQPIHLDPLEGPYLWAVDADGKFLVAPENTEDRDRLLKHGDLTPAPDGKKRGEARIAGILKWDPAKQEWVMDADSSYNYNRTDGKKYLTAENLDAAFKLLEDTGTDTSHIRRDYKFLVKGGEGAAPATGLKGEISRGLVFARIAFERIVAKVSTWLHGVFDSKPAPAKTEKTDERGFERPSSSEGMTRILDRAAATGDEAER